MSNHTAPDPSAQETAQQIAVVRHFLASLYGDDAHGWLTIWLFPSKYTHWLRAQNLEAAAIYAVKQAQQCDVYFGVGLRRERLNKGRGEAQDVIALPGLYIEIDIKHPVHKAQNLPESIDAARQLIAKAISLPPNILIDSGHGLHGYWLWRELWLLDSEAERQAAATLLLRFQRTIQATAKLHGWHVDGTADLARVLRIPGTFNRKDPQHIVPVTIIEHDTGHPYNPSDFEPYLLELDAAANEPGHRPPLPDELPSIDIRHLDVSASIKFLIATGTHPNGSRRYASRSEAEWALIQALIKAGYEDPVIAAVLLDPANRISEKPREKGRKWVEQEIARARAKARSTTIDDEMEDTSTAEEAEPDQGAAAGGDEQHRSQTRDQQEASVSLQTIIQTYQDNYYLPDPSIIEVNLATIAANQLPGDPVWVQDIGPSSAGKTEPLLICRRIPGVHIVSTMTEAGLLSGTSAKERTKDARGGLLRQIGAFGIVICKDFTSVLSIRHETRSQVLAALRDIYDGHYTRNLGTDGGRTLTWEGKVGFLAGCTEAIDGHHAVLAAMGHRFLFYRVPKSNPQEQAKAAVHAVGREAKTRANLAEMIQHFFQQLVIPDDVPPLDQDVEDFLITLAVFAARCRSAVDRDGYRREIELIHEEEAPARFAKSLRYLHAGFSIIGVTAARTRELLAKIALDSIPKIRRLLLHELMKHQDALPTAKLGDAIGYPTETTRRGLEDLAAHQVVSRSEARGNVHMWHLNDQFRREFELILRAFPKNTATP
jgi:hypothetical protein